MNPDSNRKGKASQTSTTSKTTQQIISDDKTPSNQHPPQPSSTEPSSPSSSLAEVEPKLVHEAANQEPPLPLSPKANLSSISQLDQRSFFKPSSSETQPSPQERQISTEPAVATEVADDSGSAISLDQHLVAKLRLMKQVERAEYRLECNGKKVHRKKRKRRARENEANRARIVRPRIGQTLLKPGLTPYEKVEKCLAELKHYIKTLISPDTPELPPYQPLSVPETPHATSTLSCSSTALVAPNISSSDHTGLAPGASSSTVYMNIHAVNSKMTGGQGALLGPAGLPVADSSSSSDLEEDSSELMEYKVEDVIGMLSEYMERVPRTVGAQEMEDGLLDIQTRVGVSPRPTWYALMSKSFEDMWETLVEYFECDALDTAFRMLMIDEEGEDDDDDPFDS